MAGIGMKGLIGLAAAWAMAAVPAAAVPADLAARADSYLESAWPADGPAVAVIVTENGRTVYAGARGMADIEAGRRAAPDDVFRLGSITKQFTAALVLQLAEQGLLSLDDPLSRFLPDYPQPGASATVRQLLNHTVGVQSYTNIPGWMTEEQTARPRTTGELIAVFRDMPVVSPPGERWAYNNSGYVLLGAIIERVTGTAWHRALDERIVRPLGLSTIRYGEEEERIAAMARGYTRGENGPRPSERIHMSAPHAAGALVGTVGDLARWNEALHGGRVVGAESLASMAAPTVLPSGESVPYGYGLGLSDVRGRPGIGHGGGIFGYSTDSIYLPEQRLFVAVFTASDEPAVPPSLVMRRIAAMAVGDPYPEFSALEAEPASLEPLFGVYAIEGGAERRFFARDGRLFTRRSGGNDSQVYAAGDDVFFYGPASLTWFRIVRDPSGAHRMEMHQQGAAQAERSVRSGPVPAEAAIEVPREVLERYVGSYAIRQARMTIAWGENGGLTGQITGQPAVRLMPVSATEFRTEGVDATLTFQLEGERVRGVVLRQGGREIAAERTDDGS